MSITPDENVHIEIDTPSTSSTTGALTVVGGVGIAGSVNIAGNTTITGNLSFGGGSTSAENLTVTNPLVFVGDGNNADTQDLGLVGEYSTTVTISTATVNNKALTSNVATLTTAAAHNFLVGDRITIAGVDATFNGTYALTAIPTSTTFSYAKTASNVTSAAVSPAGTADAVTRREYAGAVRDATDGVFKFFQDAITKPSSTVNFAEAGLTYADIRVDDITADQITGTGNLTIATNKLTVDASTGAATFSSSVTATAFFESSDKRLKKEISENPTIDGISQIKPKLYIKDGKEELGYYAQDLEQVLPSSVSEGKDGFLALSYTQVHTAKIAQLESKIEQLEKLIYELGRNK